MYLLILSAPNADLSSYKLVIAPALHLVTDATAENLKRYVQAGGTLVVTQRTGVKDKSNTVVNQRLPGLLAEVCGMEVEEYNSLSSQMQNGIEFTIQSLRIRPVYLLVCYAIFLNRRLQQSWRAIPRITMQANPQSLSINLAVGVQFMSARWVTRSYMMYLQNGCWDQPAVQEKSTIPLAVEITHRVEGNKSLHFILNHNNRSETVRLEHPSRNLFNQMAT